MSTVTIEVDLPEDWAHFSLPPALDARLTTLLDQQDRTGGWKSRNSARLKR